MVSLMTSSAQKRPALRARPSSGRGGCMRKSSKPSAAYAIAQAASPSEP